MLQKILFYTIFFILWALVMENIYMDPSIVQRESGFYIVDFEQVEFDLQPTANIFGPFKTEVAAKGFHSK